MDSLVDAVRRRADESADALALTFLDYTIRGTDGRVPGGVPTTLTYAELDERVRAVAAELQGRCRPGARVAIICPHGAGYIVAFLACLYAGVVAVPLHVPESFRGNARLLSVIADSEPEVLLSTSGAGRAVNRLLEELHYPLDRLVQVDEVSIDRSSAWCRSECRPDSLAYLQYTSGSTGAPTGVRILHENMTIAAEQSRGESFTQASILASWIPFFHDMGMICGIVMPLSAGAHSVHLSPAAFLQDPFRWLEAISNYRADWTVSPNFSLEQCVRRVSEERKRTLDLSSLRFLINGSEIVRAESVEAFMTAFADCGLRLSAPVAGYGLAEATLAVTTTAGGGLADRYFDRSALTAGHVRACSADDPNARRMIGCGNPLEGVSLRIVDPDSCHVMPDDRVGEIWVTGPNVGDGYWGQPERSAAVFAGRLAEAGSVESDQRWLRTGDLGFVYEDDVYIAGRIKEVIVIRGRNHYPSDIETTVEEAYSRAQERSAASAFSIDGGKSEELVVLMEVGPRLLRAGRDEQQGVRDSLRRAVVRSHGIQVRDLVFVRHGTLPRTTSRKIQRQGCRELYLSGELRIPDSLEGAK